MRHLMRVLSGLPLTSKARLAAERDLMLTLLAKV
jgi:hypothetical protein